MQFKMNKYFIKTRKIYHNYIMFVDASVHSSFLMIICANVLQGDQSNTLHFFAKKLSILEIVGRNFKGLVTFFFVKTINSKNV